MIIAVDSKNNGTVLYKTIGQSFYSHILTLHDMVNGNVKLLSREDETVLVDFVYF